MPEGNTSKGSANDISRRRSPVPLEIESGLRIDVSMTPAIQDNSSNIALRIEARSAEECDKLLSNLPLISTKRRRQKLGTTQRTLFLDQLTRIVQGNIERQDSGLLRIKRRAVVADPHRMSQVAAETKTIEPTKGRQT